MIERLRGALAKLASEQRRVELAAALVLVSMLLPWYSKTYAGVDGKGKVATATEAKLAIFVPSFVEASIFLVAIAILVLMFFRGEGNAFHLPFGDGLVVTAAGAWVGFLVFYRFIDQPSGGKTNNLVDSYDLSWGIFFGAAGRGVPDLRGNAAAAGAGGRAAAAGRGPGCADRRRPAGAAPGRARAAAAARAAAEREEPRAAAVPRVDEAPTSVAPAAAPTVRRPVRPERPEIDGGTQLSFDEQE